MRYKIKVLTALTGCLIAVNLVLVIALYISDYSDATIPSERYAYALKDGVIQKDNYPHLKSKFSRHNLSGIDQYTECFYALMLLNQKEDRSLSDVLNPGYFTTVDNLTMCQQAVWAITTPVTQLHSSEQWKTAYKPRLWHGVKLVLERAFPYLHLIQIHWLIKVSTFFGLCLINLMVMYHDRKLGVAFILYTGTAYFCASVLYFGGVAYSVPLLSVIVWVILFIFCRLVFGNKIIDYLLLISGGSVNAFFYQLDGSLMYAISMIFFVGTFMSDRKLSYSSIVYSCTAVLLYLAGFFGSILFKHVVLALIMGSPQVFTELVDAVEMRVSNSNGIQNNLSWRDVLTKQLKWLGTPSYGIAVLGEWIKLSFYFLYANITVSAFYIGYCLRRGRKELVEKYAAAVIAFLAMSLVVVLRFGIMKNHSDIHVHFVNRYLFVFAGSIYFYSAWLVSNTPFGKNKAT